MAVTTAPHDLISEAVARARKARHFPECNCCMYRSTYEDDKGAGYCCG